MIKHMVTVFICLKMPMCIYNKRNFAQRLPREITGKQALYDLDEYIENRRACRVMIDQTFMSVTETMAIANSSVNCVIYFFTGEEFRKLLCSRKSVVEKASTNTIAK
jgi:hypothetical protein